MNIHVPQSLESQAELRVLSMAKSHLVSAQGSKPIIGIFQDSLLGAYRMTLPDIQVEKSDYYNLSMNINISTNDMLLKINH